VQGHAKLDKHSVAVNQVNGILNKRKDEDSGAKKELKPTAMAG